MNLIEIAENLKDLPDQYLMQEVQQPTGNYPAYLVISELGRRKRMRDSAMKEMPKTTVAQDLTAPQRQQAMAQMAQMAQDQNMIQQVGGLNALPQAQQDLAAMDMLSAQPQMAQMPQEIPAMAGGGMVSFSNGGMPDMRRMPSMEEELGRRLSMDFGGMSARAVRKPEGYEVRGSADMGGFRPFMDVGGNLRPSMYGMEFNRPIEGGSMRGTASYDPETRERVLSGEMQRRLSRDSEIAARGRYSPDSGYNVGMDYRRRFNEGGEVIRAFNGLPEEMFEYVPKSSLDPYVAPGTPLPNTVGALRRLGEMFPTTGRLFGMDEDRLYIDPVTQNPITYQEFLSKYPQSAAETRRLQRGPRALSPADSAAQPSAQSIAQPTTKPPADGTAPRTAPDQRMATSPFGLPSETNLAAAERAGIEAYKKAMPDRLAEFRADLASQQKGMEARRASNLNEALIAAGLGIMGSKSPRALQAIGEGGMSGLNAYRQGIKDLRDSENALRESRLAMAKAQMLEDQGSFKAGKDARAESISLAKTAADLRNTESAINVREKMAPAQIGALNAQAAAYGLRGAPKPPTGDELMNARMNLSAMGVKPPYSSEQLNREVMKLRGVNVENPAASGIDYATAIGN